MMGTLGEELCLVRVGEDTKGMYEVDVFHFFNHIKFVNHSYQVMTTSQTLVDLIKGYQDFGESPTARSASRVYGDFRARVEFIAKTALEKLPLLINEEEIKVLVEDRLRDGY